MSQHDGSLTVLVVTSTQERAIVESAHSFILSLYSVSIRVYAAGSRKMGRLNIVSQTLIGVR
jgi:hypothetical protein